MGRFAIFFGAVALVAWSAGCAPQYAPLHNDANCAVDAGLRCPGSSWPTFSLEDINPASATFEQRLSEASYAGKVSVVSLFSGW